MSQPTVPLDPGTSDSHQFDQGGVFNAVGQALADAWQALSFLGPPQSTALLALWRSIAALQSEVSYVGTGGLQPAVSALTTAVGAIYGALLSLRDAVNRTAWWVWTYEVVPVRFQLNAKINQAVAWLLARIEALRRDLTAQIIAVRLFAALLFNTERQDRIKDVLAARKYALDLVNALHQTIENEAASGYRAGKGDRSGPLSAIVADLHLRGLINAAVNTLLVRAIGILVSTGDPVIEAAVTRVLGVVIKRSGLGSDLAGYLYGLIVPGRGGPDPKNLPSVLADVGHRLGAIEDWITGFMVDGGPEVKDAGRQWKAITSLAVDAGLLAFMAQAVVAPAQWAREVNDTVGTVANAAVGGIVDLLHKA
jgi:hypothetical protein